MLSKRAAGMLYTLEGSMHAALDKESARHSLDGAKKVNHLGHRFVHRRALFLDLHTVSRTLQDPATMGDPEKKTRTHLMIGKKHQYATKRRARRPTSEWACDGAACIADRLRDTHAAKHDAVVQTADPNAIDPAEWTGNQRVRLMAALLHPALCRCFTSVRSLNAIPSSTTTRRAGTFCIRRNSVRSLQFTLDEI